MQFNIFSLCILLIVSIALVSTLGGEDRLERKVNPESWRIFGWSKYKEFFTKVYPSLREDLARRKLFLANKLKVIAHNLKYRLGFISYYLSVNQFADMTASELRSMLNSEPRDGMKSSSVYDASVKQTRSSAADRVDLREKDNSIADESVRRMSQAHIRIKRSPGYMRKISGESYLNGRKPVGFLNDSQGSNLSLSNFTSLRSLFDRVWSGNYHGSSNMAIEDEATGQNTKIYANQSTDHIFLDLRKTGCFPPVKDQLNCASCYAFVATAVMEWWYCMQTGELVPLSEQYLVDCGKHTFFNGCNGGPHGLTGTFMQDWGMNLAKDYPYTGEEGICPYEKQEWEKAGYRRPTVTQFRQVFDRMEWPSILRDTGPMIVGIAPPVDFNFYGGSVHPGLTCTEENGYHSMVLVGYGKENGEDYWLIRNSYNIYWGEEGYFKISKGAIETCFEGSWMAEVDFNSDPPGPTYTMVDGIKKKFSTSGTIEMSLDDTFYEE